MEIRRFWPVLTVVAAVVLGVLILATVPGVSRRMVVTVIGVAAVLAAVDEVRKARAAWVSPGVVEVRHREAVRHGSEAVVAALVGVPLLVLMLVSLA